MSMSQTNSVFSMPIKFYNKNRTNKQVLLKPTNLLALSLLEELADWSLLHRCLQERLLFHRWRFVIAHVHMVCGVLVFALEVLPFALLLVLVFVVLALELGHLQKTDYFILYKWFSKHGDNGY